MPPLLDTLLVVLIVLLATAYLLRRKLRSLKSIQRDWTTGRAEVCDHCPAIKIRQAQMKKTKM
jgi:biopolymer transport protein ExbD